MTRTLLLLTMLAALPSRAGDRTYALSQFESRPVESAHPAYDLFFPERLKGLFVGEFRANSIADLGASGELNSSYHFGPPVMLRVRLTGDVFIPWFSPHFGYPTAGRLTVETGLDTEFFAVIGGGGVELRTAFPGFLPLVAASLRLGTLDGLSMNVSAVVTLRDSGLAFAAGDATLQVPLTRGVLMQVHGRLSSTALDLTDLGWTSELRFRFAIGSAATQTRTGVFLTPIIGLVGNGADPVHVFPIGGFVITVRI